MYVAPASHVGLECESQHALLPMLPICVFCLSQVKRVRCEASGVMVPKDKAIKRFIVRNMVDASAIRDLQDSCAIEGAFLAENLIWAGWRRAKGG